MELANSTGAIALSDRRSVTSNSNFALFLFCASALAVGLSLSQFENFEVGSFQYWLLTLSAALLPLTNINNIGSTLLRRAKLLLIFAIVAGSWHLFRGDVRVVAQLALLLWVLTWVSTDRALLSVRDLVWLYVALVIAGAAIIFFTDLNLYGLVPGRTVAELGEWRASFFANVAYTGLLSMAMLLILTKDRATASAYPFAVIIAAYFLVFSFVRTALLGMLLYLLMWWWFRRWKQPAPMRMFWHSLFVAIAFNLLIGFSGSIAAWVQNLPMVSTVLLQGKSDLSAEEIWYQVYRPWLWVEHLRLLGASPGMMGQGSFDFLEIYYDRADEHIVSAGSESLPTRLLAVYGIPGILFSLYLIVCLRTSALKDDRWACACFPTVCLVLMNWGSVLHPTDALFAIFMLMVVRGADGYVGGRRSTSAP